MTAFTLGYLTLSCGLNRTKWDDIRQRFFESVWIMEHTCVCTPYNSVLWFAEDYIREKSPHKDYDFWFRLFEDSIGITINVYYPRKPKKGQNIKVKVDIQSGVIPLQFTIDWTHGKSGLSNEIFSIQLYLDRLFSPPKRCNKKRGLFPFRVLSTYEKRRPWIKYQILLIKKICH